MDSLNPPSFFGDKTTMVKDPLLEPVVQGVLQKRAISKVPPSAQHTGFYSTYFTVPKKISHSNDNKNNTKILM